MKKVQKITMKVHPILVTEGEVFDEVVQGLVVKIPNLTAVVEAILTMILKLLKVVIVEEIDVQIDLPERTVAL